VKALGPPGHLPERLARALGQRGYDAEAVRRALRVEADGALLDASGDRLGVLLRFLEATQTELVVAPLDAEGNAMAAAIEAKGPPVGLLVLAAIAAAGITSVALRLAGVGAVEPLPVAVAEPDAAVAARVTPDATTPPEPSRSAADAAPPTHVPDAGVAPARAAEARARDATVILRLPSGRVAAGLLVTREGHILTQLSLLADAREVKVRFADDTSAVARRARDHAAHDLAVLRVVGGATATPASLDGAATLRRGDEVLVVGSPVGGDFAISRGRITRHEVWLGARPAFRIDALTGPRHSGGAVFDARGTVVGLLTDNTRRADTGYALYIELAYQGDAVLTPILGRHPRSPAFAGLKPRR